MKFSFLFYFILAVCLDRVIIKNYLISNKLFGIKDLYNYIDEEASTVNRYLYNIYPVLFLFTPESIPLIYIKLWPSISYIKNNKRGNEKSKFLNSPECTKILDRKDLNHNQKSDIITQLFFSSRSSQSFDIIEAKRRFCSNFNYFYYSGNFSFLCKYFFQSWKVLHKKS